MAGGIAGEERLVTKENLEYTRMPKTITNFSADQPKQYYCLGWVYRENNPCQIIWHNGGTSGHKSMIAFAPGADIGIAILSNYSDAELPEAIAFRFFDLYFGNPEKDYSAEMLKQTLEKEEKDKSEVPKLPESVSPSLPLEKYAGTYTNDLYGDIEVAKGGEGLSITAGPKKIRLALKHWDGDKFNAYDDLFTEEEESGFVVFKRDNEGGVGSVTIDMLNEDGCGAFARVL